MGLGEFYYNRVRRQSFYIAFRDDINVNECEVGLLLVSAKISMPRIMGDKYLFSKEQYRPSM